MSVTLVTRGLVAGALALVGSAALAQASSASDVARTVTVAAGEAHLAASGSSSSRIVVHVRRRGGAAGHLPVALSLHGWPGASCGALGDESGRTDGKGAFVTSYGTSTVVGFCSVKAAVGATTGQVTIVQTSPDVTSAYTVSLKERADDVHPGAVTLLRVTVDDAGSGVPSDPVMFVETPERSGSCGTITLKAATTNAQGQLTAVYTASKALGRCSVTAVEAMSGSDSPAATIWQSNLPVG